MALRLQRPFPLRQARERRNELSRYLNLDANRSLMIAVVLLCLMSLIALGQTGVVATKGYAIVALETHRTELLRERSQLQLRYASAQDLKHIRARAEEIGLRPTSREQIRYIVLPEEILEEMIKEPHAPVAPGTASHELSSAE